MFEPDDNAGFPTTIARYFLQLLVSCTVIIVASLPLSALISVFGLSGGPKGYAHFVGYQGIVCLFVGIATGWITGQKVPGFVPIGRWIWLLPSVVVVPDMVREIFSSQAVPWLPEEFFSAGEGLGGLFMFPTFSAIGYSIGMALVSTKPKWAKLTNRIPMPYAVTIAVTWIALFSLLIVLAHSFERSRIEKWSRVRTVVERPGLALSANANDLCATRTSASGFLLSTGTMVEALESRACFSHRLLDSDAPQPSGSWSVERVRVLTGSNGGAEGWVLAYGLLEELQR